MKDRPSSSATDDSTTAVAKFALRDLLGHLTIVARGVTAFAALGLATSELTIHAVSRITGALDLETAEQERIHDLFALSERCVEPEVSTVPSAEKMKLKQKDTNEPRTLSCQPTTRPLQHRERRYARGIARRSSPATPADPDSGFPNQSPTRRQCRADVTKCRAPFVVGQEDLSNIAGHGRQVNGERRQPHCITDNPTHPVSARLGPGDVKGCTCWVHANDPKPATRQQAGECS